MIKDMKLDFTINKYYLLVRALRQLSLPFPEWQDLQNRLWYYSKLGFSSITFNPEFSFVGDDPLKQFDKAREEAKKVIEKGLESKEFERLYKEAQEYLGFVKNQWTENEEKALSLIKELSRLELPDKTIKVLITHPKTPNGVAISHANAIGWGHSEDWPNYTTVYLCHEIMHLLTNNSPIMHALIHLMTDEEIRIRLNQEEEYSIHKEDLDTENAPDYFKEMIELQKKIYPYWQKYLKDPQDRNIIDLEKEIEGKIKS